MRACNHKRALMSTHPNLHVIHMQLYTGMLYTHTLTQSCSKCIFVWHFLVSVTHRFVSATIRSMMVSSNRCLKKSSGVLSSGICAVGPAVPLKGKHGRGLSVLQSTSCQENGALRSRRARGLGPPCALEHSVCRCTLFFATDFTCIYSHFVCFCYLPIELASLLQGTEVRTGAELKEWEGLNVPVGSSSTSNSASPSSSS